MTVPSLVQLKVTSAVCSFFAIAITIFRLYLRRERYWWDDACAFISMLFLFVQVAAVFMHVPDPHTLTHTDNIAAYYIMAATFYAVIWTARLAILYSVIRIDPNPITRAHLHRVGVVFILIVLILISQLFWVCEPLATWKHALSPQCPLDKQVAICQLVTDVLTDLLLIAAPLRLIRHMSAIDGTRRRLMIIFSTSIVTTIVSLVHAALILRDGGIKVVIAALVEDTFSLIVCNLPVVVTAGLRKYRIGETEGEESTDGTHQSTFGWRVASRKTGTTGTQTSDTAMDVTTVNLREFATNTHGGGGGGAGTISVTERESRVAGGMTLPQLGREARTVEFVEGGAGGDGARAQKSIVWFAPETFSRAESKDDGEADADEKDAK